MGRDPAHFHAWQVRRGVSIRAPAWGATRTITGIPGIDGVSIRAPAWGATGALADN